MAKNTEDREDLLRDATAYVRRIEFVPPNLPPIFVGLREGGEPSFYFGQDHVLQFNSQAELRRAFWHQRMVASYQGMPHWLDRGDGRVRLKRTPLDDEHCREFATESVAALQSLQSALLRHQLPVRGEVPVGGNVVAEIIQWLSANANEVRYAMHPGVARG